MNVNGFSHLLAIIQASSKLQKEDRMLPGVIQHFRKIQKNFKALYKAAYSHPTVNFLRGKSSEIFSIRRRQPSRFARVKMCRRKATTEERYGYRQVPTKCNDVEYTTIAW